ncbi:hypothetical protein Trco_001840 [Trichoderma cornu-damae]|uniref:Uncharacterized protein n=1 Tax=Trichoderma cornu-damae TaxID=654480 RepID=A0A9P8TX98_9HYPO|nr:hypothetical protein Trco_001840 [Trichoderma cornu-damae]
MNTRIIRQFGVKARPQNRPLAHRNYVPRVVPCHSQRNASLHLVDSARELGQNLHLGPVTPGEDLLHDRGADKDAREGRRIGFAGKEGELKGRLEALDLAAKVVAVDAHAEAADEFLAALFGGVGLRFHKPRLLGNKRNGRALAAGDDQGIASRELLGSAHFNGLKRSVRSAALGEDGGGGLAEEVDVFDEAALEGQDADFCFCRCSAIGLSLKGGTTSFHPTSVFLSVPDNVRPCTIARPPCIYTT